MALPNPNATAFLTYEAFGSNAGGSYITSPIPVASQIGTTANKASFFDGFPPSTMTPAASGGLPMFGQDLNGILYMLSGNVAALTAGAFAQFSATRASAIGGYPLGAVVQNANGLGLYVNISAGNTTDPGSAYYGTGWVPLFPPSVVTLTFGGGATVVSVPVGSEGANLVVLTGSLANNTALLFPNNGGQQWIVINNVTMNGYTINAYCPGYPTPYVPITSSGAATAQQIFCSGNYLYSTNISTSGLAPLASPALTGTPTAPTAAASTNTTQIATTAMVQAAIAAAGYASLTSPTFSGVPTAPTAPSTTNTTQIATTAMVQAAIAANRPQQTRAAGVYLTAGSNTVTYATAFPTGTTAVVLQPTASGATYYVTGVSASGFTCNVGVTQPYYYIAIGA